jgi:hypothetical protein
LIYKKEKTYLLVGPWYARDMARVEEKTAVALRRKGRSFMFVTFLLQWSGKLSARNFLYIKRAFLLSRKRWTGMDTNKSRHAEEGRQG